MKRALIEVDHVSRSFGKVRALSDVSLRIGAGERVVFIGTNGSGKTTLLRALLGMVRVEGSVRIDGFDVAHDPGRALRTVAYVPQIAPPLESPVAEVVHAIVSLRGLDRSVIEAEAALLGLSLSAIAATRMRDLSGGTKQKLLAACALATRAPILICDEPTANLDVEARAAFFRALERRPADSVLLLCSHRAEEVRRLVERVVELREGQVFADRSDSRPDAEADGGASRRRRLEVV